MEQDKEKRIEQCLKIIAEKEGISESKVRDEIALAISYALKSDDPKTQNFWQNIPCEGTAPTIEEIIGFLAEELSHKEH